MALHQIIYTSCKRGMDGVNDGQQVYSYDAALPAAQKDEVRLLFTYTVPALPQGQQMNEELAAQMPQSFTYQTFPDGACAVALNTYLGRDYMGEGGRFGNTLSHVILADKADFTLYPCEMMGSQSLRSSMRFEEVNSASKPEYLPTPSLIPGGIVTLDAVTDFLQSDEDHMLFYKRMVDAMLRVKAEKKRLVICDTPENLAMWIGALNYTLPQELAKITGFTTYTADPSLSRSSICGVLPQGTAYDAKTYCESGYYFVFDFIHEAASPDEYAQMPFIDFIETAFNFNVDSLRNFQTFLINNTGYREVDTKLYQGYDLYWLVTRGLEDISSEQFDGVTDFAEHYCNKGMALRVCDRILGARSRLETYDNDYLVKLFRFLLKYYQDMNAQQQEQTRDMIIDRILNLLHTTDLPQKEYEAFYAGTDEMARSIGLSIPAELITGARSGELGQILAGNNPAWKIYQILGIFSGYVKDAGLPLNCLYRNGNPGVLFYQVVAAFYHSSPSKGLEAAEKLMGFFADRADALVDITLALEEDLVSLGASAGTLETLWQAFLPYACDFQGKDAQLIFDGLSARRKFDVLYQIFLHDLCCAGDLVGKERAFRELINQDFARNPEYRSLYYEHALEDYSAEIDTYQPASPQEAFGKEQIFGDLADMCMHNGNTGAVADRIIGHVVGRISVTVQSEQDVSLVRRVVDYYNQICKRPAEGWLLLLYAWDALDRQEKRGRIREYTEEIRHVGGNKPVDLGLIPEEKEKRKVTKRFTDFPVKLLPDSIQLADYEALFRFPSEDHDYFFNAVRKAYFTRNKGNVDGELFADYVRFLTACGSAEDITEAGASLSGLKPVQLNDLDYQLQAQLKEDKKALQTWETMRDKAGHTNAFAHTVNNVLGRFRKG